MVPCCPRSCHGSVHICFGFCSKLHLILSFVCCPIVFTCSVLLLDKFAFFFFLGVLFVIVSCDSLLCIIVIVSKPCFLCIKALFPILYFLKVKTLDALALFLYSLYLQFVSLLGCNVQKNRKKKVLHQLEEPHMGCDGQVSASLWPYCVYNVLL